MLTLIRHDHIWIRVKGLKDRLERVKGVYKRYDWTFTGEMMNGIPHGKGRVEYTDGDEYTGYMYNEMIQGMGEKVASDGNMFRSQWIDGEMEGYCELTVSTTGQVQKGCKVGGYWHGPVHAFFPQRNNSTMFCMFEDGHNIGHFMRIIGEKKKKLGQLVNGKANGEKRIFTLARREMWDNGQCTNNNLQ